MALNSSEILINSSGNLRINCINSKSFSSTERLGLVTWYLCSSWRGHELLPAGYPPVPLPSQLHLHDGLHPHDGRCGLRKIHRCDEASLLQLRHEGELEVPADAVPPPRHALLAPLQRAKVLWARSEDAGAGGGGVVRCSHSAELQLNLRDVRLPL